jgi:tRNA 2-thiouridine synthesizing protein A
MSGFQKNDSGELFDIEWDAGQMGCGELLLKLRNKLRSMPGKVIKLVARDTGAIADIPSFCRITGHRLLQADFANGVFLIRAKG